MGLPIFIVKERIHGESDTVWAFASKDIQDIKNHLDKCWNRPDWKYTDIVKLCNESEHTEFINIWCSN